MPATQTRNKRVVSYVIAFFVAIFISILTCASTYAASAANGIITDANDVRWEYELIDSPAMLSIMFYDKPASAATVKVPSLAEVISLVPGAPSDLDTYFLLDANTESQDTKYVDITRREATASTSVLDMSNTSKIQIRGVKPIIDPEVETELIFGSNMVLGDSPAKNVSLYNCHFNHYSTYYSCGYSTYDRIDATISKDSRQDFRLMTDEEWEAYEPTTADVGHPECIAVVGYRVPDSQYDSTKCYVHVQTNDFFNSNSYHKLRVGGAFKGYKLKLTNFDGANFNYIGWESFADTTLADTTITISANSFGGTDIFRNSNVQKAVIKTDNIGEGIFRNCGNLSEVVFDNSVTRVTSSAFEGAALTSLDFTNTNITTIGARAFKDNHIANVNFDGVHRIEYMSFVNNELAELYLPKSINWLGCAIFDANAIKKATVAYDTMTKGTILSFNTAIDGGTWHPLNDDNPHPSDTIEELNVIAPYSDSDEMIDTHISYTDYYVRESPSREDYEQQVAYDRCQSISGSGAGIAYNDCWRLIANTTFKPTDSLGDMLQFELDYGQPDLKKNVIAPRYFYNLHGLKKIMIGEGYEYVGEKAFIDYKGYGGDSWGATLHCAKYNNCPTARNIEEISLPESLRGVGFAAFEYIWGPNLKMEIPRGIEFIGYSAFRKNYFLKGDVDFPNLVALGDFAFDSTMIHNIVLHDKLRFMGVMVFADCPNLNDVTFDLDIFNPDIYISWAAPGRSAHFSGDNFQFRDQFGKPANFSYGKQDMESWGLRPADDDAIQSYNGGGIKFGTITFTEKAVSLDAPKQFSSNSNQPTGRNNDFFAFINADKIDMSKTGWKELTPRMFDHATIDEILLPEHLEVIPGGAFAGSHIKNELVIPDSVKVIGHRAFGFGEYNRNNTSSGEYPEYTTKITKLPSSLEYVGIEAFYGDYNLTADLNCPNLKRVYIRAFMRTRLRDVTLPNGMEQLNEATFADIPTLRNITIDFDLGALPPSYYKDWTDFDWPQSLRDFAGAELPNYLMEGNLYYSLAGEEALRFISGSSQLFFYSIFNKSLADPQNSEANKYDSVTFTDNAKTPFYMVNGGYFCNLQFGRVDLSNAQWTRLSGSDSDHNNPNWLFGRTKIDKLILPNKLEELSSRAFAESEINSSIEIPSTVTIIGGDVFLDTKINGDVIILDGDNELSFQNDIYGPNNAFLRATIDGTVTIPGRVKEIASQVFMGAKMDSLELKDGIESFGSCSFFRAEIGESFSFPSTVKSIGDAAFMYAKMHTTDSFKEGLESVGAGAFIHTNFADDLVIPSTVTHIGWSAFNAGDADVHYNTVHIKPDLTIASAANQRVHQLLWNTSIDKLIVDSRMLVAMDQGVEGPVNKDDGGEEFWNMDMQKVILTNIPKITYAAFNKCDKLEVVDMSQNANIRDIDDRAFAGDTKLHVIKFSPEIKEADVHVGQYAFKDTAFTSIGDNTKDIDITAAKFYGSEGYAFAEMPKLETVDIPATFTSATIPEFTFYNNPELREATLDYHIKLMGNGAFANDNKLERIFIWGNTVVLDENLPGYEAPVGGMGADGDDVDGTDGNEDEEEIGPTIPEGTDIYAYSVSPTEAYAGFEGRDSFEGVFYPLDEVLYLTSNKPYVKLDDEDEDFDKSNLVLYAMRRDGIILESDEWHEFDGVAYSRLTKTPTFEKMEATIADNPDFGAIWDTPVPLNELDLGNENYIETSFAIVPNPDIPDTRKINIVYTDKYTRGTPDTDLIPNVKQEENTPETPGDNPGTPFTFDNIMLYVFTGIGSLAAALVLLLARKKLGAGE